MPCPCRRLSDRIFILCQTALKLPEGPDLVETLDELQRALHEHAERLRGNLAVPIIERRKIQACDPPATEIIKVALIKDALIA